MIILINLEKELIQAVNSWGSNILEMEGLTTDFILKKMPEELRREFVSIIKHAFKPIEENVRIQCYLTLDQQQVPKLV